MKHEEQLAEMRRTHEAAKSDLQLQLDQAQQQADHSERQRLDDSSRVHEELLEVRAELHKTRSEHESMYANKLVPAQVRIPQKYLGSKHVPFRFSHLDSFLSMNEWLLSHSCGRGLHRHCIA